jgi:excisionase family DNA binding protein
MLASMTTDAIIPMGAGEACELLDVSRDTLIRMIARGVIKGHKLKGENGQWVCDRPEIERLAAAKAKAAAS